jgi:hypothetical protein
MASQVLNGPSNPSYTNNTGQNVRIVINFMYSNSSDNITLNWAGLSVTEGNIEAIGKHIACGNAYYGDYFQFPFGFWSWWRSGFTSFANAGLNPRSAIATQNLAIKMPDKETDFVNTRRGFYRWLAGSSNNISGFSISVALPLEIFLAPGQTFSAVCGSHNILVIKEDGN